jgi:hypothetical protein
MYKQKECQHQKVAVFIGRIVVRFIFYYSHFIYYSLLDMFF